MTKGAKNGDGARDTLPEARQVLEPKTSGVYRLGGPTGDTELGRSAAALCWAKLEERDIPGAVAAFAELKRALRMLRHRDVETRRAGAFDHAILVAVRDLNAQERALLAKLEELLDEEDELTPA